MVRYLPSILRLLWKRPCRQQKQNQNNYLLQLPLELILMITEFLSPIDLVLFSQTCHSLQDILQKHASATRLSRTEYLLYLAGHARGKPQMWVCGECMILHPIVRLDTPTVIKDISSCPHRKGEIRYDTRLWQGQIRIEHRHIQLALKYTRMQERKYNAYLQALLAPHHGIHIAQPEYSAYPKVVAGCDGNFRFLLLSTWRYKSCANISIDIIERLSICPHIALDSWFPNHADIPGYPFQEAIKRTIKAQDRQEQTGACLRCATDFSVQLDYQFLNVHVWQDFGPEGSPLDLAWKTHCAGIGLDGDTNGWLWGPMLYHEPGTIRKLYCMGDREIK